LSDSNHRHDGPPEWVNCQHSIGLLLEYLDGTLPADEHRALDRHFKACPPCIDFVRKYRSTAEVCKQALTDEIPDEMASRLTSFLNSKICKP
jgi:anti-sigma factor RsiW